MRRAVGHAVRWVVLGSQRSGEGEGEQAERDGRDAVTFPAELTQAGAEVTRIVEGERLPRVREVGAQQVHVPLPVARDRADVAPVTFVPVLENFEVFDEMRNQFVAVIF